MEINFLIKENNKVFRSFTKHTYKFAHFPCRCFFLLTERAE